RVPTVAERFRAAGYDTAAFVSGFPLHRRFGLARGFDPYDDRFPRGDAGLAPFTERRADQTVAAVREWLGKRPSAPDARPFFLWTHFFDPHRPYDPPAPFRDRFGGRPYDGEIAFVDAQIGELLKAIGDPAADRTIVIVAADHGEGLDEHGEPTHGLLIYESTIRVPLLVIGPGVAAGRVVDTPAGLVDIAPTVLDIAHLPALADTDGRSLRAALGGPSAPVAPSPIYVESMFGRLCCGWAPLSGWRDGPWMYIDAPEPELYDLRSDPKQLQNVAQTHAEQVARFQREVRAAARASGPPAAPRAATSDAASRMASLGYFSGGVDVPASLVDPKRMAALAERMENAIAREQTDPAEAARELRAVVEQDPSNPLARRHLAIALSAAHDLTSAIREAESLQKMGDASAETAVLLGDCLRLAGRSADAVRMLQAAAAREAPNADLLDAMGRALAATGQMDAAASSFAQAASAQPDDVEALQGLADVALARGDLGEARRRLEALRARDPDDPAVDVKLGTVLARSGELQSAIATFKSVVDRYPRNVDACVNLAAALAKTGDTATAVQYFDRAIAEGAVSPVVFNGLAVARLQLGDRAAAAAALRRSLTLRPDQADIRDLLLRVESGR
ncbi:MAG TPA: tetratricopeptide repeat protein, partial [Vicinamibacterales bacterium]|nr:tetratricopeptide repeat protein [Vicinamibacterales bacterium]